jgi:dTDP-glucose 4,6-dehydratase
MTRVLVTGACGFAGSHIVEWFVNHTDWEVVALDCLTYAGNLAALKHLPQNRVEVVHHDFRKPFNDFLLNTYSLIKRVDYIVHNGAESHVMRSLKNPAVFVDSNITGTVNMLEAARHIEPAKFIYVSTDEVFGPAKAGYSYTEKDALWPSNPYSATKAAGELYAHAYRQAFGVPVIITRSNNMFGERQHPEKFVPMTIRKILQETTVDIHTNGEGVPNTRQWMHASTQASALLFLLEHGTVGEKYHVGGSEYTNLEIAQDIANILMLHLNFRFVDIERQFPGHDHGYSVDDSKIRRLGWKPPVNFFSALCSTVDWTKQHPEWLAE